MNIFGMHIKPVLLLRNDGMHKSIQIVIVYAHMRIHIINNMQIKIYGINKWIWSTLNISTERTGNPDFDIINTVMSNHQLLLRCLIIDVQDGYNRVCQRLKRRVH